MVVLEGTAEGVNARVATSTRVLARVPSGANAIQASPNKTSASTNVNHLRPEFMHSLGTKVRTSHEPFFGGYVHG